MSFTLTIDPEWNIIRKIKDRIHSDKALSALGADFVEATKITAIELIENAFKYSEPDTESIQPIEFSLSRNTGEVRIVVRNPCTTDETKQTAKDIIDRIRNNDPFSLYVERMHKIQEHPDGYSRLGFYRIAYEAEYILECTFDDRTITITASRSTH